MLGGGGGGGALGGGFGGHYFDAAGEIDLMDDGFCRRLFEIVEE